MRIAVLALLTPTLCLAQVLAQPRLTVDARHFSFGNLGQGHQAIHRFKVTNTGNAPLLISGVKATCGCTSSLVGKPNLAPGEATEIEVAFNTTGLLGTHRKTVDVLSNDPANPVLTLSFDGNIQQAVRATTEWLLMEGLKPKDRRKDSVKVESGTGVALRVTRVDLSKAPWLGVATREDGKDLWVDFDLLARKLPAKLSSGTDTITLHLANPKPTTLTLSVHWEKYVPVVITPARVTWADTAGQELHASVGLQNRENLPFRILATRTSHPALRVTVVPKGAAVHQDLEVVLGAEAKAGTYDERIYLTLDTPGRPEVSIKVAASLR